MQVIAYRTEEISDSVKDACMEFLATVCTKSRKGKEEVSRANECFACISFASECITTHAILFEDASLSKSTGDLLLDTMTEKQTNSDPIEILGINLVLSCISLLSSILRVKVARMVIIQDVNLKDSMRIILEKSPSYISKFVVSSFYAALARYATDFDNEGSEYSLETLSSTLLLCFNQNQKQSSRYLLSETATPLFGDFSKMHHYNENLVVATSCTAFEHMLPHIPEHILHDIVSVLAKRFSDIIKYEMKTAKKIALKTRNGYV